jgi:signal transduction histidine kinase
MMNTPEMTALAGSDHEALDAQSPLQIVLVEDSADDAMLLELQLRRDHLNFALRRCQTEGGLREALRHPTDIVLSDHSLPQFSGMAAIAVVREMCADIPVIIVSGAIGEESAVAAIRAGAVDYVIKDRLGRLGQAIRQSVSAARMRSNLHMKRRNLVTALARLEKMSAALVDAQEKERKHLARELHDELGQELNALKLLQHSLQAFITDDQGRQVLTLAEQTTAGLIGRVRDLSVSLRPPSLDMFGLETSLRQLLQRNFRATQTDYVFEFVGVPAGIDSIVEITAYRLVQECVTNITRHARARQVVIEINGGGSAEELEVIVRDDGVGFASPEAGHEHLPARGSTGLLGMRERVELLGGVFSVHSRPGHGTRVSASLPLRGEAS